MPTRPESAPTPWIHAAGVVALRGTGKRTEVLVVHRPDRNDWSLPKGKVDAGERLAAAAVRETFEETKLRVTLGVPLQTVRYRVVDPKTSAAAKKSVYYWRANILDGAIESGEMDVPEGWEPNLEVDELRWVRVSKLPALLSYPADLDVIEHAVAAPARTSPFVITRHAQAEKRPAFRERVGAEVPDVERPLTPEGEAQALALASVLAAYGIERIASSSAVRCMTTMEPYANQRGLQIDALHSITEEAFAAHPRRGVREMLGLFDQHEPSAVCIHRPTKKRLMRAISAAIEQEVSLALAPAEYVVLHRAVKRDADGEIRAVRMGASTWVESGPRHEL